MRSDNRRPGKLARTACAVAAAVGLAVSPAAAVPALASAGTEDCLFVRPFFGPPTSQVNVAGCGFWPFEGIEIYLGTSLRARSFTNGRGEFFTTLSIPGDESLGARNLTAVGLKSHRFARTTFLVANHP
ncbi:hypothetical protein [Gandjariella thermophila]|uniref:Uncharacterized protein n=1 Tax=Gandjariella thermophila TaxID=1931992 RepID=A0A4D4JF91_9PSEU|nr:hypothetical protein [Gandjariella thermophila]GDY33680.1 hypothetical protein GTS_53130 [Gandjariella thermophila]